MKPLQIKMPTVHDELTGMDLMSIPAELINMNKEWTIYFEVMGSIPTRYTAFVEDNMFNVDYNTSEFTGILKQMMDIPEGLSISTLEQARTMTSGHKDLNLLPKIHFCSCIYIQEVIDIRYSYIYTLNRLTSSITKHKIDKTFFREYADAHDAQREFYYLFNAPHSIISISIDKNDAVYKALKAIYIRYIDSLVDFLL